MNPRTKTGLILAFCVSLGVHGVAYASLATHAPEPAARELVSEVSIEVKPAPPPPVEAPVPPAEPPPVPTVAAAPPTRVASVAPAAAPTANPAPVPAAAAPLDLSGVTLTNDTGSGFAMPTGDGSALRGPIGALGSRAPATPVAAPSTTLPTAPTLVPVGDLSEHPQPPALAGLLRANYPNEARQRGLRGTASVRARIDLDGLIRSARLLSETAPGFGSACRRTVLGSRWSAPRDKNGRAVATEIVYTCHFEVDQ